LTARSGRVVAIQNSDHSDDRSFDAYIRQFHPDMAKGTPTPTLLLEMLRKFACRRTPCRHRVRVTPTTHIPAAVLHDAKCAVRRSVYPSR
jgi:hypothetical protein